MADCKESTDELDDSQPPVVMKYDAAEESGANSTNGEKDRRSVDRSRRKDTSPLPEPGPKIHCPVLTASKFGNSFGVSQFSNPTVKTKPTLLRPSQLSAIANNPGTSAKTVLQPAKFRNPFAKPPECTVMEGDDSPRSNEGNRTSKETESEEKLTDSGKPKFLPLGSTTKENENGVDSTMTPSASTPSFVFGQNLKERVTVGCDADSSDNSEKEDAKSEESNENGSPELMFSNAATVCRSTSRPGLTLSQAAQEMEEASRANKRKYSQVTLLTGEEGETNVHQIDCKLFAFDKATRGWQERGRGTLRLNDREEESRLVGRAAGTQRLLLNTKVWPGMTAERAGPKSLRLTAMDVHGDVRIFIVQAAPKEVDQLHGLLMQRLKRAQERQPKKLATDH